MIDLDTDFPTSENFQEGIQRCLATISEAERDMQYLVKRYVEGNYYMTAPEVAKYLRCEEDDIPDIRRTKSWGRHYIYLRHDVDAYLASKVVGGKGN